MGETIKLTAEDGFACAAYRAEPSGTPKGGLVVIQEIFGVTRATAWKRRERSQIKLFFYFTTGNQALDQRISRVMEQFDHTEDFSDIDEEEEE